MTHGVGRMDLFVTEACNLACPYCFAATRPRANPTEEHTRKAVDWLMRSSSEKVHVTLWGGEPMLRRDLLEATVTYAKQAADAAGKRVSFSMPTNATLLDAGAVAWLAREGVMIFLSIDGDEAAQVGRPRKDGGSSHAQARRGMLAALGSARRDPPAVRMTVTPDNAARQGSSVRYFLDSGARKLLIYPAFDQVWSAQDISRFEEGQREVAAIFARRLRACQSPAGLPVLEAWRPILRRLLDGVPRRPRHGPLRHCGAGTRLVAVAVDGALSPCHRFVFSARAQGEGLRVGDLDGGLDEVAASPFARLRVEGQRGATPCVECSLFDLCTFGCPAINYAATGDASHIPAAACALVSAQVRVCQALHAELGQDPRYRVHLGRSLGDELRRATGALGSRAFALYHGQRSSGGQPGGRQGGQHGEDRRL